MRLSILLATLFIVLTSGLSSANAQAMFPFGKEHFAYFNVGTVWVNVQNHVTPFPLSEDEVNDIVCSEIKKQLNGGEGKVALWGCKSDDPNSIYFPGGSEKEPSPIRKDLLVMRILIIEALPGYFKQKTSFPIYKIEVRTSRLSPLRCFTGEYSHGDQFAVVPFMGDAAEFKEDFNSAIGTTAGMLARFVVEKTQEKKWSGRP